MKIGVFNSKKKDTNSISKFEKQETISNPPENEEREQKTYKRKKSKWKTNLLKDKKEKRMLAHEKKRHTKKLTEDAALEEGLGEKQESSIEICGREIETCENIEVGKQ